MTEQQKSEWLAQRKIGSSDTATLLGLNPYQTKRGWFLERLGVLPARAENEAMHWGTILEATIAKEFSERTGLPIEANGYTLHRHFNIDFLTATPDFFVMENGERGILEIKNRGFFGAKASRGDVSDGDYVQVQHQMMVTGLHFAYVATLAGGQELLWQRVEEDLSAQSLIAETAQSAWADLEAGNVPEPTAEDLENIGTQYQETRSDVIEVSAEMADKIAAYKSACELIKEVTKAKEAAQAILCEALGHHEQGVCGAFVLSWKPQTRTTVDSKALKLAHPDIYKTFSKESTFRTFKLQEA